MLFLIEYDRPQGVVLLVREFDDASQELAEDARLQLELSLNKQGIEHEVVLLDAKDRGALLRTHSRYFEDIAELAKGKNGLGKDSL